MVAKTLSTVNVMICCIMFVICSTNQPIAFAYEQLNTLTKKKIAESFYKEGVEWHAKKEFKKAIMSYTLALESDPSYLHAYNNRGLAFLEVTNYKEAIMDFSNAIKLNPNYAPAYYNCGLAQLEMGDSDNAITNFTKDLQLRPNNYKSYVNRGNAYSDKGMFDKALADFQAAAGREVKDPWAYDRIAWVRGSCPNEKFRNGVLAVEAATHACELSKWSEPVHIVTLAASYAESGDFIKAVHWQQISLDLLPENSPDREDYLERLRIYKDGRPYRAQLKAP